jgi:diguanylate cyclase (GGDEF)-like protein/PAS domain S-box-containing protein
MVYLSVISFAASILYFFVGFSTLKTNIKSELFRIFFLMTLSLTIWSFTGGFLYLSNNIVEYSFWNKAGAFGWCSFEALVLYFVVVLTENRYARSWYVRLLILLPIPIFLYMVLFLFGPGIETKPLVVTIFYTGNFLYNFTYLFLSIIIIFKWGYQSKSQIKKKQADVIVITSIIPFLLNLLFQKILPFYGFELPNMGQIFTLIMLLGVNFAITQYQFMSIPTSQISNELFNELVGLAFLIDSEGIIMKANKQSYTLLKRKPLEILGRHISETLKHPEIQNIMKDCEAVRERISLLDITISIDKETVIPFNITIIPLKEMRTNLLRGFLIIGEDIRTTKRLQDEVKKHKETNNKLQNSENLFRNTLEITPVAILLISKVTGYILYLNAQAAELFGVEGKELIGEYFPENFIDTEDRKFLVENMYENKSVSKNEIHFKRKNGTEFVGLINMIPSVYYDEEVALACIIDMTEQKKVEETLKLNNDYINELNKELIFMNNNLVNKSIKDGLTNLYNHQYMNELLEKKLKEAPETKQKLCLMMLDIDHFKRVNDNFGHQVGDTVLSGVADLIEKNTSSSAYIGRYGGEEFIALLPDIDMEDALLIAERIRLSIGEHDFGINNLRVTISIGVVQYQGEAANSLINKADMLLYQAKRNGRNRVENQIA